MSDEPEPACAVWWFSRTEDRWETFADEEEAAAFAYAIDDDDDSVVEGVQFADGRTFTRDSWPALAAYAKQRQAEYAAQLAAKPPPPPPVRLREVRNPFHDHLVTIWSDDEAPSWIGLPYP